MMTTRVAVVALLLAGSIAPAVAHEVATERAMKAEVERSQRTLEDLGYPVGGVDGRLGARTRTAVRNFQRDKNLNATGQLDPGTMMALDEAMQARRTAGTPPADAATIRRAQTRLGALGYPVGDPDGQLGPGTRTALRNYQRDKNLNATGELDAETQASLDKDTGATAGAR
jgi:peptidoglycan hydrolase-like protein with peptidoglycan-binding domain